MKQKILLVALVAVGIIATSCQKKRIYSSDPVINEWAQKNSSKISKMTYYDIVEYDSEAYQKAIYINLAPDLKAKFWVDKVADVLTLPWNEAERAHLIELQNIFASNGVYWHEGMANAKSEEERDKFRAEMESKTDPWIEYAKETLGWDKDLLGGIVATTAKLLDTKGTLKLAPEDDWRQDFSKKLAGE